MKRIESIEGMLDWAKRASVATRNGEIVDLQDEFARTEWILLKKWFSELDKNDKPTVFFSIQKIMGSDSLMDFIKWEVACLFRKQVEAEEELLAKRHYTVALKEFALDQERRGYVDKIKQLEEDKKSIEAASDLRRKMGDELNRQLYEAERQLEEAHEELEKLRDFEAHIGSLLQKAQ